MTPLGSSYPHVPAAIDLVSSDDYGDMSQVKNTKWFYNKFLYPKCVSAATASAAAACCSRLSDQRRFLSYRLLPHQRVMLIPPTYNVTCCAAPSLPDVDACLLKQMRLYSFPPSHFFLFHYRCLLLLCGSYLDWADDDALVAGRHVAKLHAASPLTFPLSSDIFHWSTYGPDIGDTTLGPLRTLRCGQCDHQILN
jgi:hypothetical protein